MGNKILIVDDDSQIRDWLKLDLQLSGFTIDTAMNGKQGLYKALEGNFDLIVLDVMMPEMDGFEVCKNLRSDTRTRDIPVILLTAKGTIEDKVIGFNSGADDYLVKPFDIQELLVRLRALLRRNNKPAALEHDILKSGDFELYADSLEVKVKDRLVKLTPTEFEILFCLLQHVNQAVSLATLLDEVWGYDADEDVRMVRVHVGGLRNKIEVNPKKPQYVQTVTSIGYKLSPIAEEEYNEA